MNILNQCFKLHLVETPTFGNRSRLFGGPMCERRLYLSPLVSPILPAHRLGDFLLHDDMNGSVSLH